ncbi:MAG: hypothetical protein QG646_75 [Euryarchaeota archaeon]|nr:hypothetical protein [Euryarchaeota archaeon]
MLVRIPALAQNYEEGIKVTSEDKLKLTWKMRFEIILIFIRIIILYIISIHIISSYIGDGDYLSGKTLIVFSVCAIIMMYMEKRQDKGLKRI